MLPAEGGHQAGLIQSLSPDRVPAGAAPSPEVP